MQEKNPQGSSTFSRPSDPMQEKNASAFFDFLRVEDFPWKYSSPRTDDEGLGFIRPERSLPDASPQLPAPWIIRTVTGARWAPVPGGYLSGYFPGPGIVLPNRMMAQENIGRFNAIK
jgi:hypothetical protein